MDERYRWNEQTRRFEEKERDEPRRWRDEGERSELKGRDYYGVSGDRGREPGDNRAWEGREPYPKDLGGINRPGEERSFGARDPLTGDRGSAGGYSNAERDRGDYRGAQYGSTYGEPGQTYGGGYTGQTGTGYAGGYGGGQGSGGQAPGGGYGPGQASRDYRADRGGGRYVEGGYEDYTPHYDRHRDFDREREHDARSWWAKARDEFRAWMGDREAERRLRMDHERDDYYGRHGGDWRGHDDDTGWRDPIRGDGREDFRREEPREHRPGWFRDDDGRGRW